MKFIGIDPGKSGGVAMIDGSTMAVSRTPVLGSDYNISEMAALLRSFSGALDCYAVLERAQAMPGQGVVSMFEFGRGYGIWLGLLTCLSIPHTVVHSRVWTKQMLMGVPGNVIGKDRNVLTAKSLFPHWDAVKKIDLQLCDAILLAEYARRIYTSTMNR